MPSAFTVLWDQRRVGLVKRAGDEGKPLKVLFGGIHQSAPSLKRAHVSPGDLVVPVFVSKRRLYVIAGAVVQTFIELSEYALWHLKLSKDLVASAHEYQLLKRIEEGQMNLGHRQPYGCGIEVALVERSSPITFGAPLDAEQLADLQFCPRSGKAAPLKHVQGNTVNRAVSLQGNVRRLCPNSARMLAAFVGLHEWGAV